MTAQEIIEKLKTEVERQLKEGEEKINLGKSNPYWDPAVMSTLSNFHSLLSDLEKEEKPSEGLEEEIERYLSTEWELDEDLDKDDYIYGCTFEDLKILARHFAKWGAEHLKK